MTIKFNTLDVSVAIVEANQQAVYDILSARYPEACADEYPEAEIWDKLDSMFQFLCFHDNFQEDEDISTFHLGHCSRKTQHNDDDEEDFKAIAHLIEDGGYIEFESEQNYWKYVFSQGKMTTLWGNIVWEEPPTEVRASRLGEALPDFDGKAVRIGEGILDPKPLTLETLEEAARLGKQLQDIKDFKSRITEGGKITLEIILEKFSTFDPNDSWKENYQISSSREVVVELVTSKIQNLESQLTGLGVQV